MQKIRNFLKKYSWVWIFMVVIIALLGDAFLQRRGGEPSVSPTPVPVQASYRSVFPGRGTESDLSKLLGNPLSKTTADGQTSLEYRSTNIYRHHVAIVEEGKVVLIKEIVNSNDEKTSSSIVSVYGEAPEILYNKTPNSSFNLYVYPANGIAYLGHPDGTLLEIWYFQPTTINDFLSRWALNYSFEPVEEEGVY